MVRTIAPLVYYDRVDGTYIKVGTGSWQHWLSKNTSFRYESFWGGFTAYQEYRGEELFWVAHRQVQEQIKHADLGTSQDLTVAHLVDTAKKLGATNTAPWEGKHQTQNTYETFSNAYETSSNALDTIPKAEHREINAVSQWCIFYTHPNGRVEFLGACWEKEQAITQLQNFIMSAHYSNLVADLPNGISGNYGIREEWVIPTGYTQTRSKTDEFNTKPTTKEVELTHEVSKLRHQISELQKQIEQERSLNSNNDTSIKFIWN
jgi:hypothetical protein